MTEPLFKSLLILDFSTLLPGPLATLMLAECGARVIKIERPPAGDEMRGYEPKLGGDSVNFAVLNRGKESLALDLKDPASREELDPLIEKADILVEQFRPGVMARLGLGYADLRARNPGLIYCSISGYGQDGPKTATPGHDLNYMAESGCLSFTGDGEGNPVLPPVLLADIGGGAYPAMMNILMALIRRQATGAGCHVDIAMADNVFPFAYWGLGEGFGAGQWPEPGSGLVCGGTPRYQLYRARDGRHLAVAALEDKFWANFCDIIGLAPADRDESKDPESVRRRVAEIIARRPSAEWMQEFDGRDACVSLVHTLEEAVTTPQIEERGLLARKISGDGRRIPALPLPIDALFRDGEMVKSAPGLGEGGDGKNEAS